MEKFFGNIGGKLKKLAFYVAIIGIVICVISGILVWFSGNGFFEAGYSYSRYGGRYGDGYCFLSGLLVIAAGSLSSYIGSWMLYAFGTLVENSQIIADKLTADAASQAAPSPTAAAPKASSLASALSAVKSVVSSAVSTYTSASSEEDSWTCGKCGTSNAKSSPICKSCGHKQHNEDAYWICPKCQTPNPKTSFTCKDCGHSR